MNIINAIINLIESSNFNVISQDENPSNRINHAGDALETYIKDLFAGTINEKNKNEKLKRYEEVFSYTGNSKNPPDLILKNGDAIEVKKVQVPKSTLALNSSFPKNKLYSDSTLISKKSRECEVDSVTGESWDEKDLIYIIGTVPKNTKNLKSLIFVYGEDFAANQEYYKKIFTTIKNGILEIKDVNFVDTKELGKSNKVDPLEITDFRIRGMWHVKNPYTIFENKFDFDEDNEFNFGAIINKDKWESLNNKNALVELSRKNDNISIQTSSIKDPNDPKKLKDVVVIKYFL